MDDEEPTRMSQSWKAARDKRLVPKDWATGENSTCGNHRSSKPEEDAVVCPRCGSSQLSGEKRGFGFGQATVGGLLLGPVGRLAGVLGKNKVLVLCLSCGHQWRARRGC